MPLPFWVVKSKTLMNDQLWTPLPAEENKLENFRFQLECSTLSLVR